MNNVFGPHPRRLVLVFFDNILIYSKSMKEHLEHLKVLFAFLELHGLMAKESKCVFGSYQMTYLGHIITKERVSKDPQKNPKSKGMAFTKEY
jgi:hypothetical protein